VLGGWRISIYCGHRTEVRTTTIATKASLFFLIKILLATGFAPLALAPYLPPTADTLFFNTYKWFFCSDIAYL
jgi:hypothetical protein